MDDAGSVLLPEAHRVMPRRHRRPRTLPQPRPDCGRRRSTGLAYRSEKPKRPPRAELLCRERRQRRSPPRPRRTAIERQDQQRASAQGKLTTSANAARLFYNTGLCSRNRQPTTPSRSTASAVCARISPRPCSPGHALKTQGRAEEARTCWRQALEMKPELAQGYFAG